MSNRRKPRTDVDQLDLAYAIRCPDCDSEQTVTRDGGVASVTISHDETCPLYRQMSTPPPHEARCRDGWLGEDSEGRPIPCYVCRPHLRKRRGA